MATQEKIQVLAVLNESGGRGAETWKRRSLQCFTGTVVGAIRLYDDSVEVEPGYYMVTTDWRAGQNGRLEKVITKVEPAKAEPVAKS